MSEGKEGEAKINLDSDSEEECTAPIVKLVQDFCLATEFEKEFEDFAEEHYDTFHSTTEMKDSAEHQLEFYDIYNQYLTKFEGKIERFLEEKGYSSREFYGECRKLLSNEDDFSGERFFVECLLATSEYESFFRLMRSEMQSLKRNRK